MAPALRASYTEHVAQIAFSLNGVGHRVEIAPGETLGIVGESGCGKSLTALAIMGLLPEGAQVRGSIQLGEQELTALEAKGI